MNRKRGSGAIENGSLFTRRTARTWREDTAVAALGAGRFRSAKYAAARRRVPSQSPPQRTHFGQELHRRLDLGRQRAQHQHARLRRRGPGRAGQGCALLAPRRFEQRVTLRVGHCIAGANHKVASTAWRSKPSGLCKAAALGAVDRAAFQPDAGHLDVLHEASRGRRLAGGRQPKASTSHPMAWRPGAARRPGCCWLRSRVGDRLHRQPLEPAPAASRRRTVCTAVWLSLR
jgi:hypothetical protein